MVTDSPEVLGLLNSRLFNLKNFIACYEAYMLPLKILSYSIKTGTFEGWF